MLLVRHGCGREVPSHTHASVEDTVANPHYCPSCGTKFFPRAVVLVPDDYRAPMTYDMYGKALDGFPGTGDHRTVWVAPREPRNTDLHYKEGVK